MFCALSTATFFSGGFAV